MSFASDKSRGTFSVRVSRKILFTLNVSLKSGTLRRWKPKVTIDRSGAIRSFDSIRLSSSPAINSAAKKALKKTKFPALPADFDGEKLIFAVRMNYAIASSAAEERNLRRQGRVSGRQVASKNAPMAASIEILDDVSN